MVNTIVIHSELLKTQSSKSDKADADKTLKWNYAKQENTLTVEKCWKPLSNTWVFDNPFWK
jgi:hypothetical protein